MVAPIKGVVKGLPLPKNDPPELASYQFNVPALPVAESTTVPASHRLPGVVEVIEGVVFTVIVTLFWLVQVAASVTRTVYVVVEAGVAVGLKIIVLLKPAAGVQA